MITRPAYCWQGFATSLDQMHPSSEAYCRWYPVLEAIRLCGGSPLMKLTASVHALPDERYIRHGERIARPSIRLASSSSTKRCTLASHLTLRRRRAEISTRLHVVVA